MMRSIDNKSTDQLVNKIFDIDTSDKQTKEDLSELKTAIKNELEKREQKFLENDFKSSIMHIDGIGKKTVDNMADELSKTNAWITSWNRLHKSTMPKPRDVNKNQYSKIEDYVQLRAE
jgi:hypothetical protein